MKNVFRFTVFFLSVSLITISCSKDVDIEESATSVQAENFTQSNTRSVVIDGRDYTTEEALYDHLSRQSHLPDMSTSEEFVSMHYYAEYMNLDFDIQRSIDSYNDAVNAQNTVDPYAIAVSDQIFEIIMTYNFSNEAQGELQALRNSIENDGTLDEEHLWIPEHIRYMEYLCVSPAFSNYLDVKYGAALQSRGFLDCLFAMIKLSAALIKCGTSASIDDCVSAFTAFLKVLEKCGRDSVIDMPCLFNPDPCCGVTCVKGFYCNMGTCVEDPNAPGCIQTGCPEGFDCINNECVPQ